MHTQTSATPLYLLLSLNWRLSYVLASISRLLKITGLFCRIWSLLQGSFAKETHDFKEPTNRSHPIALLQLSAKFLLPFILLLTTWLATFSRHVFPFAITPLGEEDIFHMMFSHHVFKSIFLQTYFPRRCNIPRRKGYVCTSCFRIMFSHWCFPIMFSYHIFLTCFPFCCFHIMFSNQYFHKHIFPVAVTPLGEGDMFAHHVFTWMFSQKVFISHFHIIFSHYVHT